MCSQNLAPIRAQFQQYSCIFGFYEINSHLRKNPHSGEIIGFFDDAFFEQHCAAKLQVENEASFFDPVKYFNVNMSTELLLLNTK